MVIFGVTLAVLFLMLVLNWWSEGMIDGSDAIILATIFGGLAVGMFAADGWAQWLMAFVPLVATGAYTAYSFKLGGVRTFYKKRMEEYMLAIRQDPTNRAAREFLADTLYVMGELDRAIDEMQVAVDMGAEMEAQYKLTKWTKERYIRDSLNPICRWCHTEHPRGTCKCVKCGADLPYRNSFNEWITGGRNGKSRYYLILTSGLALVVLSVLVLPLKYAFIPVLILLIALGGWSLISSART